VEVVMTVTAHTMAKALTRKILGAHFNDFEEFFNQINGSIYDVVVFISRKAYLLYIAAKMCGIELDENIKVIYSDRILKKPDDDEFRFADRNVLLVEDAIGKAAKLGLVYAQLKDAPENERCAALDAFCFACNMDIPSDKRCINENDFQYLVPMTTQEVNDFSAKQVELIHKLGLAYTLELPIYSKKQLDYTQFMDTRIILDEIQKQGWDKEEYALELRRDTPLLGPNNSSCLYVPSNVFTAAIAPHVLTEHVVFKYAGYASDENIEDEQKIFSYAIVPVVLLDGIVFKNALTFFTTLAGSDQVTNARSLASWLEKLEAFVGGDKSLHAFNIHKSLTYLLSYCLGLRFSGSSGVLSETSRASAERHFGKRFINDFVHTLTLKDVAIIEGLLPILLSCEETPAQTATNDRLFDLDKLDGNELVAMSYSAYTASEQADDCIKHGRQYVADIALTVKKLASLLPDNGYYFVSLRQLLVKLSSDSISANHIMRHILLHQADISVFSFDLYLNETSERMMKCVIPGENSFLAALLSVLHEKSLRLLKTFYMGVGKYERMTAHLKEFVDMANPLLAKLGVNTVIPSAEMLGIRLSAFSGDEVAFNDNLLLADEEDGEEEAAVQDELYYEAARIVGLT
jgi:hypothetical protein